MEFFASVDIRTHATELQRQLRINNLPRWCAAIYKAVAGDGERGDIECLWGEFRVHREMIRDGVRFSLPGCANALQWTVTADEGGKALVHCTINRAEHAPEFVKSLRQFVEDWRAGLESGIPKSREHAPKGCGCAAPWFG